MCTRRKWPNRLVAKTSCRPSELRRSCWVKRPSAVANMLMTFLQWEETQQCEVALVYRRRTSITKQVKKWFYLENRPLKNALTFSCGFGIIPALRYRKSILLYLEKHKHASKINLSSKFIVERTSSCKAVSQQQCYDVTALLYQYLALTSWAAASTDCAEPTSRCSKSTWASGWEVRRAERAASARCMFLQARHSRSWLSSVSSLSHRAKPMPLQKVTDGKKKTQACKQTFPRNCVSAQIYWVSQLVNTEKYPRGTIGEEMMKADRKYLVACSNFTVWMDNKKLFFLSLCKLHDFDCCGPNDPIVI